MKAGCILLFATAAMLLAPYAATAQLMTPKDINYLATLSDNNRPYYERFVLGVLRFSGVGTVDSTVNQFGRPEIAVDMGAFGQVTCQGLSVPGLKPGDRIAITGSVGGASTAASVVGFNADADLLQSTQPRLKVKDWLLLLTGSCAGERVSR